MVRSTFALALFSAISFAQNPTAAITGQVKDSTGAGVSGARVTARNLDTNTERSVVTGESADYTISLLLIGRYEVRVEKEGFKKDIQTGFVLQVDQRARIDFSLQLGQVSETVEVSASAPLLNSETASVGTVIDNRKVVEMPLNSREFYALALLVPGVAPPAQGSLLSFRGGFNVAGASELNNNFTLNGLDNNNQLLSAPAYRPSIDAIQEFKILTGTYSAEYGRNSGGQVIITTKSGTNQFHGNAFEFLRNQVLDARNFFAPPNTPTPGFKRNQFGGTFGGPILRNKTFFFASYEGLRLREQVAQLATVPTSEMLRGDFRSLLSLPTPVRVLNPITGQPFRTANVIDPELINPIGRALANFYPAPTTATPNGRLPANNFNFQASQQDTVDQGSLKLDHTFSPKDSITGSYNDFDNRTFDPFNIVCGSRVIPGFGCAVKLKARLAGLTQTHILTPNLINEFRVSYSQFWNPREGEDSGIDFNKQYNIQGATFQSSPPTPGVPQTAVNGFATLGAPTNFPQIRIDHTYQLANNLSFTRGKHSLKFGGDFRRFSTNGVTIGNGRGSYTFNAQTTAATSGYSMADLLLGLPTTTSRSPLFPNNYTRSSFYGGFIQDDFRVNSRLTLNLGLRYEVNTPVFEKYNRLSNFDPGNGKLIIQGQDGAPKELYRYNLNDWGPRVGFAWQPFKDAGKTVIRAGAGFFYNAPASNNVRNGPQQSNTPFVRAETFNASRTNPIYLNDPFPLANAGAGVLVLSAFNTKFGDATLYQWSFNVQRQLTKSMVLEAGYQGSRGVRLPQWYNINQPAPGLGTVAQVNARRPYPAWGNITFLDAIGQSTYHGLVTRLEHRYSAGLTFTMSYTWAKSIDTTPGTTFNVTPSRASAQNSQNLLAGERGLSGFDFRQRLVFSPIYEIPVGKLKSVVTRDWQLSGIFTYQSGRPFTALVTRDQSNTLGNLDRPNMIGNPNSGPKTVDRWFNTDAFVLQPAGQFGNAGRNNIEGPGIVNVDIALSRRFVIRERFTVQVRAESFNLANHTNFNLPVQALDNPAFGRITSSLAPRQIQFGLKIGF